jgi:tricorn protease
MLSTEWGNPIRRDGGEAKRLTTGIGVETNPRFSPDGSMIAFTGEYDGNIDVFVIPAEGGVPRRLTYHPDMDDVVGWTPDGRQILFRSPRNSHTPVPRLFTVPATGGFPREIPLPTANEGCYSPDGKKLVYVPVMQWQPGWKRYRGGQTLPIWIVDPATSHVSDKIPRDNSNDSNPIWVDNSIYFLSDRNGPVTLFRYDLDTKNVTEVIKNDGFDFKSATAGPGGIVIEQFGALHLYDFEKGPAKQLDIRLTGDTPEVRPHYVKVGKRIVAANISPTGARAVFEARGEILTVPAEKGDIRNLTIPLASSSATPPGLRTANGSPASQMNPENMLCPFATRAAKERSRRLTSAARPPFFITLSGRRTARRSRIATSGSTSGMSISRRGRRSRLIEPCTSTPPSDSSRSGLRTAAGSPTTGS